MNTCKCGNPGQTIQLPPIKGMKGCPSYEVTICQACMQKAMKNTLKKMHGKDEGVVG